MVFGFWGGGVRFVGGGIASSPSLPWHGRGKIAPGGAWLRFKEPPIMR
jgi:hypothetical protein